MTFSMDAREIAWVLSNHVNTYHSPSVFTTNKTLTYYESNEPEEFFWFVIDGKLQLNMTQARVRNITNVCNKIVKQPKAGKQYAPVPPPNNTIYHYTCTMWEDM